MLPLHIYFIYVTLCLKYFSTFFSRSQPFSETFYIPHKNFYPLLYITPLPLCPFAFHTTLGGLRRKFLVDKDRTYGYNAGKLYTDLRGGV